MGDFPYFYTPLPHDPHPLLCCSRLQEDQRPGFNFQTVPKLNFLVHFLAFVLAGESLGPDESYYRSVFLIDSTHCWWFLTQSVLLQKLKNVAIFSLREIKYMYYALLATANMLNYRV